MNVFLGAVTIIIAAVSYSIYFRDVISGRTKPHAFTWLIWSSLNTFVFYAQYINNGGPGAWVTGAAAIANGIIFLLALRFGERNVTMLDWICLFIAVLALGTWIIYPDGELSMLLACAVLFVGFIPTFRKSIRKPHEETAVTFALNSVKFFIALFALSTISITTASYPFSLFVLNGFFAIFLLTRRRTLGVLHK